ncbi:hypothetical protein ACIBHX_01960 [Nonomuraea sp. NPDC050536]|uniref:hypothetical protein n=1 Tax=Nonomuraea sp. NPDC050536 TaxID=3364366 RepID=UPI0037C9C0B1
MTEPTVGAVVHYLTYRDPCRAAIVTSVTRSQPYDLEPEPTTVTLTVLHPGGMSFAAGVRQQDGPDCVDLWHWPSRCRDVTT